MHRLLYALVYFLSGFTSRDPRKIVFGAWLGKKFADNPKYLLLHLIEQGYHLDFVWIADEVVRPMIPSGLPVRFVRRHTIASCWELLTAGACFVTHGFSDIGRFNLMRRARKTYLGHGMAIKHMGSKDQKLSYPLLHSFRRLVRHSYAYDHYIASSFAHREKLIVENATCNIAANQIVSCGQPRIDCLLKHANTTRAAANRTSFLAAHGIPAVRHIISYLPTFRDKGTPVFSFAALEGPRRERLESVLEMLDAVILEKGHFAETSSLESRAQNSTRVRSLRGSATTDTQELLLATDLLITDYSGCYVDFLVLRRPILHFAYDRAEYENADRGLYFNFDEIAGGPIVQDFEELCIQIEQSICHARSLSHDQECVRQKLTEFERGTACEFLARHLFGLELNIMRDTAQVESV
jgi:CDP-glycerol glycerophosphotransferase (TagB/SpsB family)